MDPRDQDEALVAAQLDRYDRELRRYRKLRSRIEADFAKRLEAAGYKYFHVSARVKSRESFERKVRRAPDREVQDILGVRVVANFEGDLPGMEQIVREALIVDDDSWVDKSELLPIDAFGYRSVQFVGRIPEAGNETVMTGSIRAVGGSGTGSSGGSGAGGAASPGADEASDAPQIEVQLRTALSDTWSELEHDFRYKSARQLPREVDRLFALSAALLEQADDNLDQIRRQVDDRESGPTRGDGGGERGYIGRFIQYDGDARTLDQILTATLDLPFGVVTGSGRELRSVVRAAGWMQYDALVDGFAEYSELGRRLAIACASTTNDILLTDAEPLRPPRSFRGIGVYWTALAAALVAGAEIRESRVPDGRIAEYRTVATYLYEHPDVSALDVRRRYQAVAAPPGSADGSFADLGDLG
ncbi:GTP pyrophosphokinase family protein [Agromyces sp. NPDC058110]|uniref:GTP pyrophosphokinase n=1 Tax=Agromyces sp. NPDC058110 TaxID=3346345 RepID=UPI0036DACCE2